MLQGFNKQSVFGTQSFKAPVLLSFGTSYVKPLVKPPYMHLQFANP